jgi:dipeptidyl aminopeptidase/acylaminoacyl peptidase
VDSIKQGCVLCIMIVASVFQAACNPQPDSALPQNQLQGMIYFTVASEGRESGLWRMSFPDGRRQMLDHGYILQPPLDVSPDQHWIAYVKLKRASSDDQWGQSLWVIATEGGTPMQVSRELPRVDWRWLPDGRLFYTEYPLYRSDPSGQEPPDLGADIVSYAFDPEEGTRTLMPDLQFLPPLGCRDFFSPLEATHLVERCVIDSGERELRFVDTQEDVSAVIRAGPYTPGGVAWSPDGQSVAFTDKTAHGHWEIFVWDSNSGSVRQATNTTAMGEDGFVFLDISWSPDGQRIAFTDGPDLCVARVADGQIDCFEGYVSYMGIGIAWLPDGRSIVLSSARIARLLETPTEPQSSPQWDIFIIDIESGDITRVTDDAVMELYPVWVNR